MELGAATISAILFEWKAEISIPNADKLRQFSTELRRLGITASLCTLGCRILGVLRRIWILESFALQLYQSCQSREITFEAIVECSQEILSLAKTEKIPISRIPQYIEKMIVEKRDLEAANIEKGSSKRNWPAACFFSFSLFSKPF
jgi:hypothetical protein